MATFAYTHAAWDKIRPATLGKTGLGDALKKYESAKQNLQTKREHCTEYYVLARTALDAAEKLRAKAIEACGKNPLYKAAKTALSGASPDGEKNDLAALLGNHMVNILGTFPGEAQKHKTFLEKRIQLLEGALNLYKTNQQVPKELAKAVESRVGSDSNAFGNQTFPGQEAFKEFIGKKSTFKTLLPEVVKKCEEVQSLLDAFPGLNKRIAELAHDLQPYVN